LLVSVLTLALVAALPFALDGRDAAGAYAASDVGVIDLGDTDAALTAAAGASGGVWSYDASGKIITVNSGADVAVTGATTARTVQIATGAAATVTLSGASIDVSAVSGACAFGVAAATATVVLRGDNTLKSGECEAGLFVSSRAAVIITSAGGDGSESGTLAASGGDYAAGIGGGYYDRTGITDYRNVAGTITIKGGTITATGGLDGAGIGGGPDGNGGMITIDGGRVEANGGEFGAGIGGGSSGSGGITIINGGTVVAKGGEADCAGIGGGSQSGRTGTVTINGGTVTAIGGPGGPGIGGMNYGTMEGEVGVITINGGVVNATGGYWSAGIGGKYSDGGIIIITGGTVTATGGVGYSPYGGGAGIGGGQGANGGTISISGGTVTATGGTRGAGIGGGSNDYGYGGCGGDIAITGGIVTATGGSGGSGIGGGWACTSADGSFALDGDAVVIADTVDLNGGSVTLSQGVLFDGDDGVVYGDTTLPSDLTVGSGQTLTVTGGATLTVPDGVTLTNGGAIDNDGAITNNGLFRNDGTIDNSGGSFTNNGILTGSNAGDVLGDQTAPAAPTLASKTRTGVTLNIAAGCEYSLGGAAWQASPAFTGLSPGTAYLFYQRRAATPTLNPSPASAPLSVTTEKTADSDGGGKETSGTQPVIGADGTVTLPQEPTTLNPLDIAPIPLAALTVTDRTWTGKRIRSGFTIKFTYKLNGRSVVKTLKSGTDYAVATIGSNKSIGKGSVTITGRGIYKGSKKLAFRILPKVPSRLKLTTGKGALTLIFTKPSKFAAQKLTGYQAQYRYKSGSRWSKWKTKTMNVSYKKKARTHARKLSGLKAGKTYQVRVRAYRKAGEARYYGAWTPAKSKRVK
jgi:hypothetical protein